ncbi:hypothetical protein ACNKHK_24720 [Shigella flexneri]
MLWRILIFYVGAIFVIVTIFPWNEIGSNSVRLFSPLPGLVLPPRRGLLTLSS